MDSKESETGLFLREIPLPEGCEQGFFSQPPEQMNSADKSYEQNDEELVDRRWRRWLDIIDR